MLDHGPTGVAVTADDVEHSGGKELGGDLRESGGGRRRGVARLQHHGVPGSDGRGELPHRHHHRIVPRSDLRADPNRLTADHRGHTRHVLRGGAPLKVPGGAGEESDLIGHRADLLSTMHRVRLAAVARLDRHQLVAVCLDGVSDPNQRERALRRGGVSPALERRFGGTHRAVDVCRSGDHRPRVLLSGRRIDHRGGRTVGAVAPLATDEVSEGVPVGAAHGRCVAEPPHRM